MKEKYHQCELMVNLFSLSILILIFIFHAVSLYHYNQQYVPPKNHYGVVGEIASLPRCQHYTCRFNFKLDKNHSNPYHGYVWLGWYGYHPPLQFGQKWYFTVRLRKRAALQGGSWLLARKSLYAGYVLTKLPRFALPVQKHFSLLSFRQKLANFIGSAVKNPHLAAIIMALTVGVRASFTPYDWRVFQYTGTTHLIAISGLHIGFVFILFYRLIFRLLRCSPYILTRWHAPICARIAALMLALGYGVMAGMSLSTQRSLIMLFLFLLPSFFGRQLPAWRRMLTAFILLIALEPLAVFHIGFWLSFGAVATILYCGLDRRAIGPQIFKWLKVQFGITLLLLPLTLYFFGKVSLLAELSNLVAIPWISFLIVPLALLASVIWLFSTALAAKFFLLAAGLLWPLWWSLSYLSHFSWSHYDYAGLGFMPFLLASLAMLLLLLPRGFDFRWFGLVLLLPLFIS
jgi:competence protein ComEC